MRGELLFFGLNHKGFLKLQLILFSFEIGVKLSVWLLFLAGFVDLLAIVGRLQCRNNAASLIAFHNNFDVLVVWRITLPIIVFL